MFVVYGIRFIHLVIDLKICRQLHKAESIMLVLETVFEKPRNFVLLQGVHKLFLTTCAMLNFIQAIGLTIL